MYLICAKPLITDCNIGCINCILVSNQICLCYKRNILAKAKVSVKAKLLVKPKKKSEFENRRMKDNAMTKRKGTNNDRRNIHIKLRIE